jgi:hypothetical protein
MNLTTFTPFTKQMLDPEITQVVEKDLPQLYMKFFIPLKTSEGNQYTNSFYQDPTTLRNSTNLDNYQIHFVKCHKDYYGGCIRLFYMDSPDKMRRYLSPVDKKICEKFDQLVCPFPCTGTDRRKFKQLLKKYKLKPLYNDIRAYYFDYCAQNSPAKIDISFTAKTNPSIISETDMSEILNIIKNCISIAYT